MGTIDHILDNEIFNEKLEATFLKRHEENPTDVFNLIQLANTFRKKGDLKLVRHYSNKIVALEPQHRESQRMLAILNHKPAENIISDSAIRQAPFIVLNNFLAERKIFALESIIRENKEYFETSKVSIKKNAVNTKTRKSKVLGE